MMNAILNSPVLVLNRLWQPVHVCSARRALKLLCLSQAEVVQTEGEAKYQTHNLTSWIEHSLAEPLSPSSREIIRSVRVTVAIPKVIVLSRYDRLPRKDIKLSRQNVFQRDKYTCQYCWQKFSEKDLNLDHVLPKDKGGKTTWVNIVTSCIRCNTLKANKLLHESNMQLMAEPKKPRWRPLEGTRFATRPPESWKQFIQPDKEKVKIAS